MVAGAQESVLDIERTDIHKEFKGEQHYERSDSATWTDKACLCGHCSDLDGGNVACALVQRGSLEE